MVKQIIVSLREIIKSEEGLAESCHWSDEEKEKLRKIKERKAEKSSNHYATNI